MVQSEHSPLLTPVDRDAMQDPSTDLPGFVANQIEQQDHLLDIEQGRAYGSTTKSSISSENEREDAGGATVAGCGSAEFYLPSSRILIIMLSMFLGIFLAALDGTIVSTLLTHIGSEFNSLDKASWIATSYLLSSSTCQPLYGKLSDHLGRKPLLVFSNAVFAIGCLICGLSNSIWAVVAGRFISGIGGCGLTSLATMIMSDLVPLRDRAVYQGLCNFVFGLGTASGGLVGAYFRDWRLAFILQCPISVLSGILIVAYLELPPRASASNKDCWSARLRRLDWAGATSLIAFLFLFMLTSSMGGSSVAYGSRLFAAMCAATLVFGAVFVYVELRVAADPVLPVSFLRDRSVLGSSLANWFCMMSMMTTNFYLPVYWSSVLGMKATDVGKRAMPSFFSVAFGSLGAGLYMKRTGKYYYFLLAFCVLAIAGQVQIALITPQMPVWRQYLLQVVPGFGVSVLITVTLLAMIAAVPHEHHAATTSISYAFRSTGATLGVSVGAAVFRSSLTSLLDAKVMRFASDGHSERELRGIIASAARSSDWVHRSAPPFVRATLLECYHFASRATFKFCLTTMVLAGVSCSIIKEHKLHTSIKRGS